jgi:hypothetical protein
MERTKKYRLALRQIEHEGDTLVFVFFQGRTVFQARVPV